MTKIRTVYLSGGGTGGHLFPAISIAQELEKKGLKTRIVTDERCQKYLPQDLTTPAIVFKLGSMSSGIIAKIITLLRIIRAFFVMCKEFYLHKPSLVIGFGGYASLPALLAAKLLIGLLVLK